MTSCYESILLIREGDPAAGVPLLGEALQQLRNHVETPLCSMLHTEYVSGLAALRLEPLRWKRWMKFTPTLLNTMIVGICRRS